MSMVAQLLDKFINAKKYRQDNKGVWIPEKEPTLKMANALKTAVTITNGVSNDLVVFENFNKKIIIDAIEFTITGSASGVYPILHIADNKTAEYNDQIFHTLNQNTNTRYYATPVRLANDGSPYFDVYGYDATGNTYKFISKQPIILPQGGRLAFRANTDKNTDGVTYKYYTGSELVQYKVIYRVWE